MKTTKRTMGALAFLAAFIMVASAMAPLVDAGAADSSAPVLFSAESDEGGSVIVLRTWTNENYDIRVDYIKAANSEKYGLDVRFGASFPLNEFVSVDFYLPGHLNMGLNVNDIISANGLASLKFDPINSALGLMTHTLTISDKTTGGTSKTFTIELPFTAPFVDVSGDEYYEKADDAKEAINKIWYGSEITDIDNRTMYMIYNQTGVFDDNLVGKLYFKDKEIYHETLDVNTQGQHIWYFSFAEGAPAKISGKYAPGEYTMKLFAGEDVVAEATAEIPEFNPPEPDPQFMIFVESVRTDGKITGFKTHLFAFDGKLPAGSIELTYDYAVAYNGYVGVVSHHATCEVPESANYWSVMIPCSDGDVPVSAYAVFEYADGSSTKTVQSETILVWGQA